MKKTKIIEILNKLVESQRYDYYTLRNFADWIISEIEKPSAKREE